MVPPNLEILAMRAVEVTVLGREDQRMLVATKRSLTRPKRVARLLAGLANTAAGRHAVLLLGVSGREVAGLEELPTDPWWDKVERAFPGRPPNWVWSVVDIDGAQVVAIVPDPPGRLVAARHKSDIIVPFYDRGAIVTTPPADRIRAVASSPVATATVAWGWIERIRANASGSITAFRGRLGVELTSGPGRIADSDCSATLLGTGHHGPVALDVQVHPSGETVGVFRRDRGVDIRNDVRVEILLAAATPTEDVPPTGRPLQLVVSLGLPGRAVPELRSLILAPDPATPNRWSL